MRFALLSRVADRGVRMPICPPRTTTIAGRLREWFDARRDDTGATTLPSAGFAPLDPQPPRRNDRFARARRDFVRALDDVPPSQSALARAALLRAATLHDLWHLRTEVFDLVARRHDQRQAAARLSWLDRHFPARPTRSRPGAFDPRHPR